MTNPPKLDARTVEYLIANNNYRDNKRYDSLLDFAEYVLIDLGLDFQKGPGGAFLAGYPEMAGEDVKQLMSDHDFGAEESVYFGYYTPPERYRVVATENDKPCSKCGGGGCEEWAGEDCPSDEIQPLPVKELGKGEGS